MYSNWCSEALFRSSRGVHFFFSQPAAGLTNRVPVRDSRAGTPLAHPITGDAIGRMYTTFLEHTSITSKKKTHLARRTFPSILEEMG